MIAVAVILSITFLYGAGLFSTGSTASGSQPFETYRQAAPRALSAAVGSSGGPWAALFAGAIDSPTAALVPGANLSAIPALSSCTVRWSGGNAPTLTVPATPTSAPLGSAAFWTFGFVNSTNDLLLVSVIEGNASLLATVGGSKCTTLFASLAPLTSGVVDSPIVAQNASAAGGSSWLAQHPGATEAWNLVPGLSLGFLATPPTWRADYTTCSLAATAGTSGAVFNATLTGATGAVTQHANGTVACSGSSGLGLVVVPSGGGPGARKAI